jgi:glutamate/tyrosine decarboxylase-like PLP-dependent enzyme
MLMLEPARRHELWNRLIESIEHYAREIEHSRVTPELDPERIRALLSRFEFERPVDPVEALDFAVESLWRNQVHTPHPRYYGLFNPAPTTMGIAADTLVAAFNPQLAAWSHSPVASEIEQHLVRHIGKRFGYDPLRVDGTFTSGGAEANHTALLTAIVHSFPEYASKGVRAIGSQPVLYISSEGHHSFLKAARLTGLGTEALREIAVDSGLMLNVADLREAIRNDRANGLAPFMIVATAGTTSSGVIDPLNEAAEAAAEEKLWLHVDAAWGGAAVLVPELRGLLRGVERADSITFDAHKWLSVPMGAGLYLTRHSDVLDRTFRTDTAYMPSESRQFSVPDPYAHSIQWSRRFIGLKVFLSLAVAGWKGYEEAIRHQTAMGRLLKDKLRTAGWEVVNKTELPLACFVDQRSESGRSEAYLSGIAREIVGAGKAWISTTRIGGRPVLRACITNYRTSPDDLSALIEDLEWARQQAGQSAVHRNPGPRVDMSLE